MYLKFFLCDYVLERKIKIKKQTTQCFFNFSVHCSCTGRKKDANFSTSLRIRVGKKWSNVNNLSLIASNQYWPSGNLVINTSAMTFLISDSFWLEKPSAIFGRLYRMAWYGTSSNSSFHSNSSVSLARTLLTKKIYRETRGEKHAKW